MKQFNNCEVCTGSYEPYKVGEKEDVTAYWCQTPKGDIVAKNQRELLVELLSYIYWWCGHLVRRHVGKRIFKWFKFVPYPPHGVCQFHNPKSRLYLGQRSPDDKTKV